MDIRVMDPENTKRVVIVNTKCLTEQFNLSAMSEPHERLQQARRAAGYADAASAARAMGLRPETYHTHENGGRGLSRIGERYARFFRVSLEWLLTGKGDMRGKPGSGVPLYGNVGAGPEVLPIAEAVNDGPLEWIDLPNARDIFALEIRGDSAIPRYRPGEILLVSRDPVNPERMINQYCVLDLADGRRCAKRLKKDNGMLWLASENNLFDAEPSPLIIGCYRIVGTLSR
jgi:phage repressor protein C with HTH and peptisase S24 domain